MSIKVEVTIENRQSDTEPKTHPWYVALRATNRQGKVIYGAKTREDAKLVAEGARATLDALPLPKVSS